MITMLRGLTGLVDTLVVATFIACICFCTSSSGAFVFDRRVGRVTDIVRFCVPGAQSSADCSTLNSSSSLALITAVGSARLRLL